MYLAVLIAFAALCGALALEKRWNDRCLSSLRAVIHVNGIRGKTSTCRLLDAALRGRYRVMTKTTGTDARIIGVDGRDLPLRRFGPANIGEQLRTIRRARREGAEILILECMAVRPELQRISQEQMVKSGITVITNVRHDHPLEMGDTLEKIAGSLAATVPTGGVLYTADETFYPFFSERCQQKGSRAVLCPPDASGEQNRSIARTVALSLGVPAEEIEDGFSRVQQDFGICRLYTMRNGQGRSFAFLNLFSANDPQSAEANLAAYAEQYSEIAFLYNHRSDRPDRALLFAERFFPAYPGARVYLIGEGRPLAQRLFLRAAPTLRVEQISFARIGKDMPEGALLVGIGNIKGEGHRLIEKLESEGAAHA